MSPVPPPAIPELAIPEPAIPEPAIPELAIPELAMPALHASHSGIWLADGTGAVREVSRSMAINAAADTPLLLINAPLVGTRLGYPELSGLDLLEAFAFVRPAQFCVPTPRGLAHALALGELGGDQAVPLLLRRAAGALLALCTSADWPEREGAWSALQLLAQPCDGHGPAFSAPRIAQPARAEKWLFSRLPQWEETPERPQPAQVVLDEEGVEQRLERLTGTNAEQRSGQRAYAKAAARIFAPRPERGVPTMLLAQAGTGIGKTLGYLAPASLWAEQAQGTVWVSTYTKNLQRQLRREKRACMACTKR